MLNLKRNESIITTLVTPDMGNFSRKMHGGELLKLLDRVAYACASRYSGHYSVTLSVDKVLFKQPINVGELITCIASVNYTGRSSMEVGIKVTAENIHTHEVRHTNTCFFTMVAIDEETRRPVEVPKFVPETEDEVRRNAKAIKRSEARRAERNK